MPARSPADAGRRAMPGAAAASSVSALEGLVHAVDDNPPNLRRVSAIPLGLPGYGLAIGFSFWESGGPTWRDHPQKPAVLNQPSCCHRLRRAPWLAVARACACRRRARYGEPAPRLVRGSTRGAHHRRRSRRLDVWPRTHWRVSDELELIVMLDAHVLRRKSTAAAPNAVAQEIAGLEAQLVVVGLPVASTAPMGRRVRPRHSPRSCVAAITLRSSMPTRHSPACALRSGCVRRACAQSACASGWTLRRRRSY